MSRQTLSRQALYDAVWSQPMSRLAPTYGVTGTGLKKVCDRHDIPTPERGYWAKLANRKAVRRPPLPTAKLKAEALVVFHGVPVSALPPSVRQAHAEAIARAAARPAPGAAPAPGPGPSEAGADPSGEQDLAPLTRRLSTALAKAKPDGAGFLTLKADALPAVRCGVGSAQRVLMIVDALVRGAGAMGWRLGPSAGGAAILVGAEPVRFSLTEKSDQVAHAPTERELKDRALAEARGRGWRPWPLTDRVPSGALTFEILENAYGPLTRRFSDLKKRGLESRLDEILAAVAAHAALNIDDREKREAEQRRAREAEAERALDEAYGRRADQRMAMVEAIEAVLQERERLRAVIQHLAGLKHEGRAALAGMAAWAAFRLKIIEERLSARSLDVSARFAELEFERATPEPAHGRYHYYRKPELHLWSFNPDHAEVRSVSARRWAKENGLLWSMSEKAPEDRGAD